MIAGIAVAALVLPLAPAGLRWWKIADAVNTNLNEEFGWREMTDAVLRVRDSLPPDYAPSASSPVKPQRSIFMAAATAFQK